MKKPSLQIFKKTAAFLKTKKGIFISAAVLLVAVIAIASGGKKETYTFIPVTKGNITETVSITGNTSPVDSVALGFGSSGTVTRANAAIGQKAKKGQVLAELNSNDLYAQAKQAEANLKTQKAKLSGIEAGSRPEDIAASQAALDKARQDLANYYGSIIDTSNDAYSKANDAIRTQLDPLFFDDEGVKPQLTYTSNNPIDDATTKRAQASDILNTWQLELQLSSRSNVELDNQVTGNLSSLAKLRTFLNAVSKTLDGAGNLSATTLASYKTAVTTALNETNLASKNLNTLSQSISSQKLTISQLESQLALKQAGSTSQDIQAQQAQVESAQAALQSVYAKLQNSRIVSPINGVITQFDAKVGQLATTGTPLISIISESAFEVDAIISEIDIGKVALSNTVAMTLDAFQGETFTGTVYYIDPAQTTSEGVVGYKIKITFDATDPRLKSGLTCNIDIKTKSKESVLILPQYAILQNDDGIFVQMVDESGKKTDVPVTLGIRDQDGNVEITSGVSEGQQVLNIGLKQK